jgi:hypothetical protein
MKLVTEELEELLIKSLLVEVQILDHEGIVKQVLFMKESFEKLERLDHDTLELHQSSNSQLVIDGGQLLYGNDLTEIVHDTHMDLVDLGLGQSLAVDGSKEYVLALFLKVLIYEDQELEVMVVELVIIKIEQIEKDPEFGIFSFDFEKLYEAEEAHLSVVLGLVFPGQ